MEASQVIHELSRRFLGSRIKVTQINSPTETQRFERKVERVEISSEEEFEGFIELHLNRDVPSEYGLRKRRIIHFCPKTKTYRGIPEDPHRQKEHHIFKVEIVGLRYIDHFQECEKFGIEISGHDIRVMMFNKLFDKLFKKFGKPVVYPEHGTRIMETLGEELKERAKEFLEDDRFSLDPRERYVMEKYLSEKNFISGGVYGQQENF